MENNNQCKETAKIRVPWAGKIYKYCPVHANNIALLSQVMGGNFKAELIRKADWCPCEGADDLTDEMRIHNANFKPGKI